MVRRRIGLADYSRQEGLDAELAAGYKECLHAIVGCGGVGFWTGMFLALMGVTDFMLIDGDKVDGSNLPRLPLAQSMVGIPKVIALRKVIRTVRPDTAVLVYPKHISEEELSIIDRANFVWDCTDSARIQQKIYEHVKSTHYSRFYTKIGYEGFNIGAYDTLNAWGVDEAQRGYRTTQANVASSAIAAGLGIFYGLIPSTPDSEQLNNTDFSINIKDLVLGQKEAAHV